MVVCALISIWLGHLVVAAAWVGAAAVNYWRFRALRRQAAREDDPTVER